MSQAFVREGDDQWLSDVGPSLRALIFFLPVKTTELKCMRKKNTQILKAGNFIP